MNSNRKSVVLSALAALMVAAGLAAAAASSEPGAPAKQRVQLGSATALRVFDGPFVPTAEQRGVLDELQAWARMAPAESILVTADLDRARPVAVPGSADSVWLAPAANGGLCSFTPQPGTGGEHFGASCSTLSDLNANGIVSATYGNGSQKDVVVTVVEPDGVDDPVIASPNASVRRVAFHSNVAVTTAHFGDAVEVAGLRLDVSAPRRPSTP